MEDTRFFQHIRVPYKKSIIYTRLGFEKTNTRIEPERKRKMDWWIKEAENLCDITVVFRHIRLKQVHGGGVYLEGDIAIKSQALSRLLKNSDEAVLMAATSGFGIVNELLRLQQGGEMSRALVYDAAASEITDAGLDWLMAYLKQPLMRKGQKLTHMRYSPGYGDLELSNQKIWMDLLELNKWGVRITQKHILVPEKTVTAIVGIESPKGMREPDTKHTDVV